MGYDGPVLFSTDDCCHEEKLLMEVFTTLRSHRLSVLEEGQLPPLTLPSYNRTSCYLTSANQVTAAIGELQVQVDNKSLTFIG